MHYMSTKHDFAASLRKGAYKPGQKYLNSVHQLHCFHSRVHGIRRYFRFAEITAESSTRQETDDWKKGMKDHIIL